MKRLFIYFLLISAVGFAQKKKNHWEVAKLQGKVKSSHITEYRPMTTENSGTLHTEHYVQFNPKGYIVEMMINMQGTKTKIVESYNERNLSEEMISYDMNGEQTFKNQTVYDANGNKIEERSLFPDGALLQRLTYKYDANNREIERNLCGESNCFERVVSSYDKKGNLIREEKYDDNGLFAIIDFKYDKKGNKIEIVAVGKDKELIQRFTYKYDKKGNEIETAEYDAGNNLIDIKTFVYRYDKKGNWIEKKEMLEGQMVAKFEQKLEYY